MGILPMSSPGDRSWYRGEAQRLRDRAAAIKNGDPWRDSHLRLARAYERMADVLGGRPLPHPSVTKTAA